MRRGLCQQTMREQRQSAKERTRANGARDVDLDVGRAVCHQSQWGVTVGLLLLLLLLGSP